MFVVVVVVAVDVFVVALFAVVGTLTAAHATLRAVLLLPLLLL